MKDFQDKTIETIKVDSKAIAIKSLSIKLNIKTQQILITLSKSLSTINKRSSKSIKASNLLKTLTIIIKKIINIRRSILTSSIFTLFVATTIYFST